MGQAKLRGTKDERVKQALGNPKPKRLTRSETRQLIRDKVASFMFERLALSDRQTRISVV
jgi:hypothetical protein